MKLKLTDARIEALNTLYEVSSTDCWIWTGTLGTGGYAMLNGIGAHRYSYTMHKGEIPRDKQVDHLCSVRDCINPYHLDAVTMSQDGARKKIRNRWRGWATHCAAGHELNDETTLWRSNGTGRQCRVCQHERAREYWAREGKAAKTRKGLRKNGTLHNKALYEVTAEDYELADFDERFLEVFYACDTQAGSSKGVTGGLASHSKGR